MNVGNSSFDDGEEHLAVGLRLEPHERRVMDFCPRLWPSFGPDFDYSATAKNLEYLVNNPSQFISRVDQLKTRWEAAYDTVQYRDPRERKIGGMVLSLIDVLYHKQGDAAVRFGLLPEQKRLNSAFIFAANRYWRQSGLPAADGVAALIGAANVYLRKWFEPFVKEYERLHQPDPEWHDWNTYQEISREAYFQYLTRPYDDSLTPKENSLVDWRCGQLSCFYKWVHLVTGHNMMPGGRLPQEDVDYIMTSYRKQPELLARAS